MPEKKDKSTTEIIDHWPEIFEDIEIKSVPLRYIKAINVRFNDGKVWAIDIRQDQIDDSNIDFLEESLESFFDQYDDMIESVDFNLNTVKVKKDIESRTKRFMKKRK